MFLCFKGNLMQDSLSEKYIIANDSLDNLEREFANKLIVNNSLNRSLVSFQSNKDEPIFRWFHYREGFSKQLIEYLIDELNIQIDSFLDPFAGTGTSAFVSGNRNAQESYAIELMPVGGFFIQCRNLFSKIGYQKLLPYIENIRVSRNEWLKIKDYEKFNHLRITKDAFSLETERELMQFLKWSQVSSDENFEAFCKFLGMCILESISFTRKDGQYLRWDYRSPRFAEKTDKKFSKGEILNFYEGLIKKLENIESDILAMDPINITSVKSTVNVIQGSCLSRIDAIPDNSISLVITSPPYCNRYDYTRTYALELAYLGVSEIEIRNLRQELLSCTVENKAKIFSDYIPKETLDYLNSVFSKQVELDNCIEFLSDEAKAGKLNNKGIVTMVRGYFYDMTLHLIQVFNKLKPGAKYIMVNDNVRYNGLNIPIDLLLSKIANYIGFNVEKIWVLPRGKGNSSQQMKIYGRKELRKCIYVWSKP